MLLKNETSYPGKIHPSGRITVTQKVVPISPFMYQMDDLHFEYWQAFYYFYFGFALPAFIELNVKTWKYVKMWNLEAHLCSGITPLLE